MISKISIKKIDLLKNSIEYIEDMVAVEKILELYINENYITTFFTLPAQEKELAIGYLLVNGILERFEDIKNIEVRNHIINVDIPSKKLKIDQLKIAIKNNKKPDSIKTYADHLVVNSDYSIRASNILEMFDKLNRRSEIFHLTGGTHSSSIFDQDELISFSEDTSRHNSIDKAIGSAAIIGVNFNNSVLISSGRQSADMVIKAIKVGIPIIASISAPLNSGIELSNKAKLTLICFVRERKMNIYTCPERIIF